MSCVVPIDHETLAEFCEKWKIRELSLFGSVLRDDFCADSDIDVLVSFRDDSAWTLFDHLRMEEELAKLFGRPVDLISHRGLKRSRNWLRRDAILSGAERIYAA